LGVEGGHEPEVLAAVRDEVLAGADRELLERLETIGDERRREDSDPPRTRARKLDDDLIREGSDPRVPSEPRLKGHDETFGRETEALGDAAGRRHAVRAIAIAIDDSDLIAAAKAIPQTVLASRRIALEDLPLGQAVKAHENFLRLELIEDGTGDRGEGVEERRVIVEGR